MVHAAEKWNESTVIRKYLREDSPGHRPGALGVPGILTLTSMYPVVKQNLFHDVSMPGDHSSL